MGKASISSAPSAAHARVMRKGSSDHLVLNMGTESERLIAADDSDDKGSISLYFELFRLKLLCANNSATFVVLKGVLNHCMRLA
jgi:hypothetical protein